MDHSSASQLLITTFSSQKTEGFAESIQDLESNAKVKLILVTLRQEPAKQFVARFLKRFSETDWTSYASGDIWPSE